MQEAHSDTGNEPSFNIPNGNGVHEEMNQALSRCRASFFRSAYRFLENPADAEDAVQEALLSAYKHIDQFRGEAQISTWLTAIVSNSARMQLRKRPRNIHVSRGTLSGLKSKTAKLKERCHACQSGQNAAQPG